ncbi:MAG: hypothetical protein ACI8RD_011279 [Bacillariaceae sp.]|jgi:hypothetical protein
MSTTNTRGRANKRRRQNQSSSSSSSSQPNNKNASSSSTNEERVQNTSSKLTGANKIDVPWGPVFYPSVEDMEGSPLDYINKIRPVAQRYGICKIVPPIGWKEKDFFGT